MRAMVVLHVGVVSFHGKGLFSQRGCKDFLFRLSYDFFRDLVILNSSGWNHSWQYSSWISKWYCSASGGDRGIGAFLGFGKFHGPNLRWSGCQGFSFDRSIQLPVLCSFQVELHSWRDDSSHYCCRWKCSRPWSVPLLVYCFLLPSFFAWDRWSMGSWEHRDLGFSSHSLLQTWESSHQSTGKCSGLLGNLGCSSWGGGNIWREAAAYYTEVIVLLSIIEAACTLCISICKSPSFRGVMIFLKSSFDTGNAESVIAPISGRVQCSSSSFIWNPWLFSASFYEPG